MKIVIKRTTDIEVIYIGIKMKTKKSQVQFINNPNKNKLSEDPLLKSNYFM